jgi:hypothetical protein
MSVADPVEWEFGVPASQVDVERIVRELRGLTVVAVQMYLGALKRKAPTVYARLAQHATDNDAMPGIVFPGYQKVSA